MYVYRFAASGRYGPVLWEINVRMATTKIYLRRLSRLERRNPWPHVTNRYVHKPAIVKLLLLIYSFQFRSAFHATTKNAQPATPTSVADTNVTDTCGFNSRIH